MKKQTRRLLFYFLAFIFILLAPLLITYSLGYKFDLSQGTVEKTGSIFIKSKTRALSIFLDGAFVKETSLISGGALLTETNPGAHLLRVEKSGFHPWFKTLIIKPEIVTELRNVLMIPEPLIPATSTKDEVTSLSAPSTPPLNLYLDKNGSLMEKGIKNPLAKYVNSFGLDGADILFVDKNGFLARLDPATKNTRTLDRPGFYLGEGNFKFIESPTKNKTAILDPSGGLFILDQNDKITAIEGGVRAVYFDENGEKLLIQKDNNTEALWLTDNQSQPFQKAGTKEEIMKTDAPILDATWLYGDNAHIAVRTIDGIFITEIDGRGGRNTVELVNYKTASLITTPQIPNTLFFKKGKTFYKVEF